MRKLAMLPVFFALIFVSCEPSVSIKRAFSESLFLLDSNLLSLQVSDSEDENFGALDCPLCQLYHTRAAEALYPFSYEFSLRGDTSYRNAAIRLGNWLIAQQEENGSWKETPEEWTGTTTDQLLMMALAFPLLKKDMDQDVKERWLQSMKAAGDYLVGVMDPGFASINYVATTSATMSVLNQVLPDPRYVEKAQSMARQVVEKMDDDHFITGEGGRVNGVKHGVDLTYNMEMSLWGLALYARISEDEYVMEKVKTSLERHLWFINPDGSMDGSWGIRSNKWTCYGGSTSDGSQVLFSLLASDNPAYATAALRNLDYLHTCMYDGLVGYGPMHRESLDMPPCIYPTFAKAKNLAMAHAFCSEDEDAVTPLPVDQICMEHFPTLDVTRVRTRDFMATISAYAYKDPRGPKRKYMFRPTGGAITALWLKDYGFLQASSPTEYHRWEPMSFPVMGELKALTPRIEMEKSPAREDYFTNLFEFDATTRRRQENGAFSISAEGQLKNREQVSSGVSYSYTYLFEEGSLEKIVLLKFNGRRDTLRILEPVISYPGTTVVQEDEKHVLITQGEQKIHFRLLSGKATLGIGKNQQLYRSVYPALTACPIELLVLPAEKESEEIIFSFTIE